MSTTDQPVVKSPFAERAEPVQAERESGLDKVDCEDVGEEVSKNQPSEIDLERDSPSPSDVAAIPAVTAVMNGLSQPARLEAILYLKGRPMGLAELASLSGMEREDVEMALITLMADYAHRDTALEIFQDGQTYSLQLRQGLSDLVQVLLPVDLSTAALRTLATIALKKRILQSDLVELRGSGAYDHIKELLAQNFIERKRQSDGRSYWLTLSEKFHRTFAIDRQPDVLQRVSGAEEADSAA
jgi:segregation and condensation protein B